MCEIVEESSTYTLRMEEVIPTPPQAIEVKMGVFVTFTCEGRKYCCLSGIFDELSRVEC